jgi:hypothetical protein
MSRERAPLIVENGFQGNGFVSPRVFGAKGDGIVDDTAAIQTTINNAKTFNGGTGGTVVFDGPFRITSALSMDARVSLMGVGAGGATNEGPALFMDHPTNGMFSWVTTSSGKVKGRISNLLLSALQANTGDVFGNTSGLVLDLLLDNMVMNESTSGLLQGRVMDYEATASKLSMRNCKIHIAGATSSGLVVDSASARLTMVDCEWLTPTTYNAKLIDVQEGTLIATGCDFLAGLSPTFGTCPFINLGSTSANAIVLGNSFRGLDSNVQYAYAWSAAGRLVASNNTYDNGLRIITLSADPGLLALHSKLEMSPYDHVLSASPTPAIAPFYDEVTIELSNGAPTITLPYMLYPGRKFRLNILNTSGGSMTPAFSTHVSLATAPVNALANNGIGSYVFGVSDANTPGTMQWVLLSASNT